MLSLSLRKTTSIKLFFFIILAFISKSAQTRIQNIQVEKDPKIEVYLALLNQKVYWWLLSQSLEIERIKIVQ